MTLLQLSYFVSLADTLHYTHTAELLHVSQPSLSYSINELEKQLGVKLFSKDHQRVELTEYGKQYYFYAKKALDALRDGRAVIESMSGQASSLVRWGYFHSVSASMVPAIIHGFSQEPEGKNIHFQLIEDSVIRLLEQLQRGELDFCFTCHQEPGMENVTIAEQPLYLVVPSDHSLAEKSAVDFQDFCAEPIITLTPTSDLRQQVDELFAARGLHPRVAFETRECNAAIQYVALRFGVSILPEIPVMNQNGLQVLPIVIEGTELRRPIYLTWRETSGLSAAARCAIEYIRKNFSL